MFGRFCESCGRRIESEHRFCEDCVGPSSPTEDQRATRRLVRFARLARAAFGLNVFLCILWVVLGGLRGPEPAQGFGLAISAGFQYVASRYFQNRMSSKSAVPPHSVAVLPSDPLRMKVEIDVATIIFCGLFLAIPVVFLGRLVSASI